MANINLYVNSSTDENSGIIWSQIGATPWLNNYTGNKRYTTIVDSDTFWYGFAVVDADAVSAVTLWMEGYGGDIGNGYGNTKYSIWVKATGVALTEIGEVNPDGPFDTWYPFDISALLDTPAKVNSAEMKLLCENIGSPKANTVYAQRCYLAVTYTPAVGKGILVQIM